MRCSDRGCRFDIYTTIWQLSTLHIGRSLRYRGAAAPADKTLTTPPGLPEPLRVAVPERAVLELLYEAGVKQSLEEARNLFDGLRSPRKDLLGQLLSCCTSVKAVRLYLTWARETNLVDVDALLEQYPVRTGSAKRWMSRLEDGTLLSLRPHG